jgi:hypothetical protein
LAHVCYNRAIGVRITAIQEVGKPGLGWFGTYSTLRECRRALRDNKTGQSQRGEDGRDLHGYDTWENWWLNAGGTWIKVDRNSRQQWIARRGEKELKDARETAEPYRIIASDALGDLGMG